MEEKQTNGTNGKSPKFMIVVLGESEIGKTPAIRKTYDIIKTRQVFQLVDKFNSSKGGEAKAVFKDNNGNYIGINSIGDPHNKPQYNLSDHLNDLLGYKCKVILTACRTASMSASSLNRNPLESILAAAKAHGYKIIWTLHYQSKDETPNVLPTVDLNEEFADDMIDLIQKLL